MVLVWEDFFHQWSMLNDEIVLTSAIGGQTFLSSSRTRAGRDELSVLQNGQGIENKMDCKALERALPYEPISLFHEGRKPYLFCRFIRTLCFQAKISGI